MQVRRTVPTGLSDWWDTTLPPEPVSLSLHWSTGESVELGSLHQNQVLFRFAPSDSEFTTGPERLGRLVGKALTRAGWRRPAIDPAALNRLLRLRESGSRVEFILDTNSLVEGIGHWLVDHFADRCDLVTTAVTLRELQDAHGQARFGKPIGSKGGARGKLLGMRQLYLAANRLRERTGYPRVLWRELEVDDAALLLSKGSGNQKTSESDTLLLRAVRRSILDRVNNLERIFVTGDTALARRAASELPTGAVLTAQVIPVAPGNVLFPCSWWPGPDQGRRVVRHPARLVWELLCIADQVAVSSGEGQRWAFTAFDNPMWPSDYLEPWVRISASAPPPAEEQGNESKEAQQQVPAAPAVAPAEVAATRGGAPSPAEPAQAPAVPEATTPQVGGAPPFWRQEDPITATLADNLRLPASTTLSLLHAIATAGGNIVPMPDVATKTKVIFRHSRRMVEALSLGVVDPEAATVKLGPGQQDLAIAWGLNDLDAVFDSIRGWQTLAEWATLDERPSRPDRTEAAARANLTMLGQGCSHPETGVWHPGGRRPQLQVIRQTLVAAASDSERKTISIYRLLSDVFLRELGISPVRVARRWSDLWNAGIFEGFEAREGGSSSGRRTVEYVDLSPTGWSVRKLDLESLSGTRDLVYKEAP